MRNDVVINYHNEFDSGIYKITNTINGKIYIGQSIHLKNRMSAHRSINSESNIGLKRAYKKYGIENFIFEIIKETYDLDYWEKFFIYWYKADNPKYGYNILKGGDTCPSKNEKSRKKMSKSMAKHWSTKEGKKTMKMIQEKRKITMKNRSKERQAEIHKNITNAQKKIYLLCVNRKEVKHLHRWKIEDNFEITLRKGVHLINLYGRDVILCKGEFFVNFENEIPTEDEIKLYCSHLDELQSKWDKAFSELLTNKFKFKCIETNKIYDSLNIKNLIKDCDIISNNEIYIRGVIKRCCDKIKTSYCKFHFEYA